MLKEKSYGKWDRFERIKHSIVDPCGNCNSEIYFPPTFGCGSCESSYTFEFGAIRSFISICASASTCTSPSHEHRYISHTFPTKESDLLHNDKGCAENKKCVGSVSEFLINLPSISISYHFLYRVFALVLRCEKMMDNVRDFIT